jgi:hypothetical protein
MMPVRQIRGLLHQLELVPVFLLLLKFGELFQNEFTAGLYRPQNPPIGKSITDACDAGRWLTSAVF